MSLSRAATFSLYIIVAFFLPISLAHADGKAADLMCNPVKAECGCGQLKDKDGKCQKVGKEKNMYLCECFDKTTVGKCTEPNYCKGGDKCVGIDCAKPTEQQIKDSMQSGGLPGAPGNSTPDAPVTATGLRPDGSNIGPGSSVLKSAYESMTNPTLNQSGSQTPEPGSSPWSNSNSAQNFNEFVAQQAQIGQSAEQQAANQDTSIGGALQRWGADFLHLDGGSQSLTPVNANGDFVGDSIQTRDFNPNGSTFSQSDAQGQTAQTSGCDGWWCPYTEAVQNGLKAAGDALFPSAEAKPGPVSCSDSTACGAVQRGTASWYNCGTGVDSGPCIGTHDNPLNPRDPTIASGYPLNTVVQACSGGRCVAVVSNDDGGFRGNPNYSGGNRVADMSPAAFQQLAPLDQGVIKNITLNPVARFSDYQSALDYANSLNQVPVPQGSPWRMADSAITQSVASAYDYTLPSGAEVTQQFLDASSNQVQSAVLAQANADFATSGDTGISTGVAPTQSNPDFASSGDTGIASPAQEFPASPSGVVTQGPEIGQPNPVGEVTRGPDLAPISGESVLSRSVISNESGIGVDFAAYQDIAGQDLTAAQVQEINDQGLADRLALADQQQAAIDAIPKPDTTLPTGEALTNEILKSVESQVPVPEPTNVHLPTQDEMISALVPKPDTTLPSGEAVTADVLASAPGSRNPFTGSEPIELATQPTPAQDTGVPKGLEGLIRPSTLTTEQQIELNKTKLGEGLDNPKYEGISIDMARASLVDGLKKQNAEFQQKLDDLPLPQDQTPEQAQQQKDLKASIDANEAMIAKQSEYLKGPIANMNAEQLQKYIDTTKTYINNIPSDTPGVVAGLNYRMNMAQEQLDALDRAVVANIDATAAQGRLDNPVFEAPGPAGTVEFFQNEYAKVLAEQKNMDDMLNVWNASPEQYMAYDLKTNGLAEAPSAGFKLIDSNGRPVEFSAYTTVPFQDATQQYFSATGELAKPQPAAGENYFRNTDGSVGAFSSYTPVPAAAEVAAEAKPLSGPDARDPLSSDFQTYAFDAQKPIAYTDFQKYQSLSGEPLTPEQAHAAGLDNNEFTGKFPDTTKTETVTPKQDPNVALAEQRIANLDANINRAQALLNRNEQDPQTIANAKAAIRAALVSADNTTAALKGTGSDTGDIASASARLHQLSAELDSTSLSKGQIQARLNDASAQVSRWDQALPDTPKPYSVTTTIPGATYTVPAMAAAQGVPFADAYSQYQNAMSSNGSVPAQFTGNWEPQYPSDNVFPTQQDYAQIAEQFPSGSQTPSLTLEDAPAVQPQPIGATESQGGLSGGTSAGAIPNAADVAAEASPLQNSGDAVAKDSDTATVEQQQKELEAKIAAAQTSQAEIQAKLDAVQGKLEYASDAVKLQNDLNTLSSEIAQAKKGLNTINSLTWWPTSAQQAVIDAGTASMKAIPGTLSRISNNPEFSEIETSVPGGLAGSVNKYVQQLPTFAANQDRAGMTNMATPLLSTASDFASNARSAFNETYDASELNVKNLQSQQTTLQSQLDRVSTDVQSYQQQVAQLAVPAAAPQPPVTILETRPAPLSYTWEPQYPSDALFATQQDYAQFETPTTAYTPPRPAFDVDPFFSPGPDALTLQDQQADIVRAADLGSQDTGIKDVSNAIDSSNYVVPASNLGSQDAGIADAAKVVPSNDALTEVPEKPAPGIFDSVKAWAQGTVDQLREFAFNREMASMVPFRPVEQSGETITQQIKDAAVEPQTVNTEAKGDSLSVVTSPQAVVPGAPAPTPAPVETPAPTPVAPAPVVRHSYNPDPFYMPGPESLTPRTPAPAPVVTPAPDENPAPKPVVIAAPAPVVQPAPGPQSGGNPQPSGASGGGASGGGGGGFGSALSSMFGSLMRMLGIGQPQQPTSQQPTSPAKPSTTTPQSATSTPPIPTVNLIANPASVVAGKKATLSWSGIGVTQCVVFSQDGTQLVAGGKSGSVPTPVLTTTTSFRVSCAASVGAPVGASVSVTVR